RGGAVPLSGAQIFRWGLDSEACQSRVGRIQPGVDGAAKYEGVTEITADFVRSFYDRVVPGIYHQFDGPAMLPLMAPRPLLSINGEVDPRTPLPGVMECAAAAQKAYDAA